MNIKKIKIGNVCLKNNIMLAPMAGLSEVGFRSLAYKFGIGLAFTEMVSVKALFYNNQKTKDLLITNDNEKPIAVQLFGHEPEVFESVIKSGILEKFDIIDINMGCPAPKIVNNGDGSALMQDLPLARQIIETVVKSTNKPVTVKFRAGFDEKNVNAVEFAKMCEQAGASAITIHGRTREQYYSGNVNKDIIKEVVTAVNIPVIANGDITTELNAKELIEYTGASGIMIGRGALGNLELISKLTGTKCALSKFEQIEYIAKTLLKYYNPHFVLCQMRAHLVHFVKGNKYSAQTKQKLLTIDNLEELLKQLKIFLN